MIIEQAKEVLKIEAEGILNLIDKIDESFRKAIQIRFLALPPEPD